jgi:hypothetical protein
MAILLVEVILMVHENCVFCKVVDNLQGFKKGEDGKNWWLTENESFIAALFISAPKVPCAAASPMPKVVGERDFFLFSFLEQILHGCYSGFLSELLRCDKG